MIEETIYEYFKSKFSIPVYLDIPANPPSNFIAIQKTGNTRENFINSAMFAIQSYAGSKYEACALNEEVKIVAFDLVEAETISSVKLNSDVEYNDTTRKRNRYQSVFVIDYYTNY